jgi:hypothetical protein
MWIRKAMLWVIFVSCPSIVLAGYLVYKIKEILLNNGVSISESVYWLVLFGAMWAAMYLSSKKLLREIFSRGSE